MKGIFRGIRPVDVVLTAALVALAVLQMGYQARMPEPGDLEGARVDSVSDAVLLLVLAPLAVLWWRRSAIAVTGVAVAVFALHDAVFGWAVRCGCGLPLTFALAFLVGFRHRGTVARVGLGMTLLLNGLVLVRDSAAGLELLPVTGLMTAGLWLTGRVLESRTQLGRTLRAYNEELRQLRDQNAALEVTGDRARLSAELDDLLDVHLGRLAEAADVAARSRDPEVQRRVLEEIESEGRATLARMRAVVGTLRGGETAVLSPAPAVEHLDALLARASGGHVQVVGDPRRLPASVELSAYRIVEHLLSVIETGSEAPVEVVMDFQDAALEIRVSGQLGKGTRVREAMARARERARLQDGTLNVRVARGRARAVALLPVQA